MSIYDAVKIENGVLRAHVKNFKELFEFSQFFHEGTGGYYFRGQNNAGWDLTTTLERFESQLNDYTTGTAAEVLNDFKRLIRGKGLLSGINPSSDEEFFSLGQHYGLPTPMLDWSESFYIALFFAFADEIPAGVENIAVWAIHRSADEAMKKYNEDQQAIAHEPATAPGLALKFVDPFTDVNARLISQSGILLQKPSQLDLTELISNYCRGNSRSPVLAKLTMPAAERERVINNLFSMNINWSTIYPGIEGAAKHTKMKLQMLDLKIRRMGRDGVIAHAQKKISGAD